MKSDDFDIFEFAGKSHCGYHILHGKSKLVFVETCGDFFVRMSIYVGVDAESYACCGIQSFSMFVDYLQFGNAFDVEAMYAVFERKRNFAVAFSDSCKNDAAG